jgi:hypothetical protein
MLSHSKSPILFFQISNISIYCDQIAKKFGYCYQFYLKIEAFSSKIVANLTISSSFSSKMSIVSCFHYTLETKQQKCDLKVHF